MEEETINKYVISGNYIYIYTHTHIYIYIYTENRKKAVHRIGSHLGIKEKPQFSYSGQGNTS